MQFRELILCERLGWEQIQRPTGRILENRVQHRRVVAERLPRRRRRDHDDVSAGEGVIQRLRLMDVQLRDPSCCQRVAQPLVESRRKRRVSPRHCRQASQRRDVQIRRIGTVDCSAGETVKRVVEGAVAPGSRDQTAACTHPVAHGWRWYQSARGRSRGESGS